MPSQQRRSLEQEARGSIHQEPNHSMSHTTAGKAQVPEGVAERKPKINWPKANEAVKYRQFDDTMAEVVSKLRGKPEWKLQRVAEVLYEEAEERFGLEKPTAQNVGKKVGGKKGGPSRREKTIKKLREENKKLRARWLEAEDSEREGLKALYEELKGKHRSAVREQRRVDRRKEVMRSRKEFLSDPYKFAKGFSRRAKQESLSVVKRSLKTISLRLTMIRKGRSSCHLLQGSRDPLSQERRST